MPRVTVEHRERRRQQILDAARRCFVRRGFHQTSMADIFAEAGLSSGAVYGYFKAKDEIIVAIASDVIGHIQGIIVPIIERRPAPTLDEVVREGLTKVEEFAFAPDGFGRLAPQVWAEASRNPALAQTLFERFDSIGGSMAGLIAAEQQLGRIRSDTPPEHIVPVVIGSIAGYILQRALFDNVRPETYAAGIAALSPHVTA